METCWTAEFLLDGYRYARRISNKNGTVPWGAGRSSEVERSLMVRWVVGSILHGVDPLSYFSFQPVLKDWCNKGRVCAILSVGWCI